MSGEAGATLPAATAGDPAVAPLSLDLARIREPKEARVERSCKVALVVLSLFWIGVSWKAFPVWLSMSLIASGILEQRFRGSAVRTGPEQFPIAFHAAASAARRLDVREPVEVFVTASPGELDVYTVKLHGRYVIVIQANWIAMLAKPELEFVLAHELAHVRAGHMGRMSLLNVIRSAPPLLRILAAPLEFYRYVFSPWSRKAEITADRLALEATGLDLASAASALAKIAVGVELAGDVDARAYVAQARELRIDWYLLANELINDAPLPVRRVQLLEDYLRARPPEGYPAPRPGFLDWLLGWLRNPGRR